MESNKDKINNLPIIDVLSKLGYHEKTHYKIQGNNIRMFDDRGRPSDGWIGSISENRLFCKSGVKAGRFEGDVIGIIKGSMSCDVAEAIKWAEESFNLEKRTFSPILSSKPSDSNLMRNKWNSLGNLDEPQVKYLEERGIEWNEYTKKVIKKENNKLVTPIQTSSFTIKALQKREAKNVEKKWRYQIEKAHGENGEGIFIHIENEEKKVIFVTEGLTDYWTLVQHGVNVIGLVSALAGIQFLKEWHKKYELIYISDNDESGEESVAKLRESGIKFNHYKIDIDDVGDLNELWQYAVKEAGVSGLQFMRMIYDDAIRPKNNIQLALEKAIRNRDNVGWLTGEATFDWATGGITPGTSMMINGARGQGKTTLAMWILFTMLKQGKKIIFFSLETDTGKMLAQILGFHFGKNWRKEVYPNIERYLSDFGIKNLDNLLLFDDIRTPNDMELIIKEEKPDVVFIDYVQIVKGLKGESIERLEQFGAWYQEMGIKYYTAMIALSQVSKSDREKPVIYRSAKGAGGLEDASDTLINVGIYNGKHSVAFIKCKNGDDDAWNTEHDSFWNKETGAISLMRDWGTLKEGGSPL